MHLRPLAPRHLAVLLGLGLWACSGPQGCACAGWVPEPQGTFQGTKLDSAGAVRLAGAGFTALNANSAQILNLFAPGGVMAVPVPCSIQSMSFGLGSIGLTVADQGGFGCTTEACGRMDGQCDADDLPQVVNVRFTSLQLAPLAPDVVEAVVHAEVQTGQIFVSSTSRNSAFCALLGGGAVKCSVDFDTTRATPNDNELGIDIRLAIDQRWDRLLFLQVAEVKGAKVCGATGALPPPKCMDPNDIAIATAPTGTCSICTVANFGAIKTLLLEQVTKSIQKQLDEALTNANCASCGPGGSCPSSPVAVAACSISDAGTTDGGGDCIDTGTGLCVPAMIGTEGRVDVGTALAAAGAPAGSALELAFAAGGSSSADSSGITVGLRGGFHALQVASCVAPALLPAAPALPLPNFDLDALFGYDVAFSVSQQALAQAMFHAQQSGALCLELGHDALSVLDSETIATLLPSMKLLTHGQNVPVRIVIRPVNPPTATLGEGTVDSAGKPLEPLILLGWKGMEIDLYALLEDRYVRVFTLAADLTLPLGVTLDGCNGLTPVIGDMASAVSNIQIKNSEMLAEKLDVLKALVPTLLTTAEPTLAKGFQKFTLPDVQGFQLQLVDARGVGNIAGTKTYNHLGVYAKLLPLFPVCVVQPKALVGVHGVAHKGSKVELRVPGARLVSWRVDRGFWSMWREVEAGGVFTVEHPSLALGAQHVVEVRTPEGAQGEVVLPR